MGSSGSYTLNKSKTPTPVTSSFLPHSLPSSTARPPVCPYRQSDENTKTGHDLNVHLPWLPLYLMLL